MSSSPCIAIIPARYASTRFPGKLLAPIAGKTLLQRTYENALRCSALSKVVIATDDIRIYAHVKSFGGNVVMTSMDCPTGTDRLGEAYERYPELQSELILNVQGDEPCVDPEILNQVVAILSEDSTAVMSTAVEPISSMEDALSPHVVKCAMDSRQNALYFSRGLIPANKSGSYCPQTKYYRHLGIYAYRSDFLLKYRRLPQTPLQIIEDLEQLKALEHGYRIKVAIVSHNNNGIGVDIPEDIQKIEKILCKQNTFL